MVRNHSSCTLTSLNLEGYEELNDLVLEFIAGVDGDTEEYQTDCIENTKEDTVSIKKECEERQDRGLIQLITLTLPTKSFVTPYGLKILLENLPLLETIKNAGRLGRAWNAYVFLHQWVRKTHKFVWTEV